MAVSESKTDGGKKQVRGNPYRCKICGYLASSDGYCAPCREKVNTAEEYSLKRDNFYDHFGNKPEPFSRAGYGVVKKDYGILKRKW
jgi:hypothetical protein